MPNQPRQPQRGNRLTSLHPSPDLPMLIRSADNPTIKQLRGLITQARQRKKLGKTVLEGTHLLEAYLNAGQMPTLVVVSEASHSHAQIRELLARLTCPSLTVTASLYQQVSSLGESLPIMAVISLPTPALPTAIIEDCLIINGVQDNGNLGTLLRTAAAVGVKQVLCTAGSASAWSPKTLRASMGANFSLSIYEQLTIADIQQCVKVPLFATSSHSQQVIYDIDLTKPLGLIMGHEGQGVDEALLSHAHPLALPQPNGQESLNVAVAGSLCLYEMLRQRHYQR